MPGRLWCRFRSGSMGSGEGLEKIGEAFGAEPGQVQQGSRAQFRTICEKTVVGDTNETLFLNNTCEGGNPFFQTRRC